MGLQQWRDSLDPQYDHVTTIQSPSDFARALAENGGKPTSGPRGGPVTYHARIFETRRRYIRAKLCFTVRLHTWMTRTHTLRAQPIRLKTMLRSAFFKHTRFRDQREYRFVVWCEHEPHDPNVYLAVSQDMRDSLAIADEQAPRSQLDNGDPQGAECVSANIEEAVETLSLPLHDEAQPSSQEQPATGAGSRDESDRPDGHDHDGTAVPIPIAVAMQMAQVQPRLRRSGAGR